MFLMFLLDSAFISVCVSIFYFLSDATPPFFIFLVQQPFFFFSFLFFLFFSSFSLQCSFLVVQSAKSSPIHLSWFSTGAEILPCQLADRTTTFHNNIILLEFWKMLKNTKYGPKNQDRYRCILARSRT